MSNLTIQLCYVKFFINVIQVLLYDNFLLFLTTKRAIPQISLCEVIKVYFT